MMKKASQVLLGVIFLFVLLVSQVDGVSAEETKATPVYVDGIKYEVSVNDDLNVVVKTVGLEKQSQLVLYADGTALAKIANPNEQTERFTVDFEKLDSEHIDATVYQKGKLVENIDGMSDLDETDYSGQIPFIFIGAVTLEGLLVALMNTAITIVRSGIVWYAVHSILEDINQMKNTFFKAYLVKNFLYINPKSISFTNAVNRIKIGKNIYTFKSQNAYQCVDATGLGIIGPEINIRKDLLDNNIYYYHYHTSNRNGSHAFYGLPRFPK